MFYLRDLYPNFAKNSPDTGDKTFPLDFRAGGEVSQPVSGKEPAIWVVLLAFFMVVVIAGWVGRG